MSCKVTMTNYFLIFYKLAFISETSNPSSKERTKMIAFAKSSLQNYRLTNLPVHYHPTPPPPLSHNPRHHGHACDGGGGA